MRTGSEKNRLKSSERAVKVFAIFLSFFPHTYIFQIISKFEY